MTEDSYVDTRVQEFADHIQCDPELAQELYFEHKVSEALDNEQKASVDRELSTLRIVSNNLDRAAKACKTLSIYDDDLRNALRIQGLNLEKQIDELNNTLKDNIAFFNASISKDISGTSSDHKANTVAKFVAAVFLALGRPVVSALKRTILVNPQHLLEEPFETHLSCSKYTESQQRLIYFRKLLTGRDQLKELQKVVKNPTSKNFSAGWDLSNQKLMDHM